MVRTYSLPIPGDTARQTASTEARLNERRTAAKDSNRCHHQGTVVQTSLWGLISDHVGYRVSMMSVANRRERLCDPRAL